MAIIDDLRKEHEESRYNYAEATIKEVISRLSEKVRWGLISKDKKPVCCDGTIYTFADGYSFGLPQDSEGWYAWRTSDEDVAKYMVENLRERILKEFRPQRLEVRYDSHTKGFFKVETYYTIYIGLSIKI